MTFDKQMKTVRIWRQDATTHQITGRGTKGHGVSELRPLDENSDIEEAAPRESSRCRQGSKSALAASLTFRRTPLHRQFAPRQFVPCQATASSASNYQREPFGIG